MMYDSSKIIKQQIIKLGKKYYIETLQVYFVIKSHWCCCVQISKYFYCKRL